MIRLNKKVNLETANKQKLLYEVNEDCYSISSGGSDNEFIVKLKTSWGTAIGTPGMRLKLIEFSENGSSHIRIKSGIRGEVYSAVLIWMGLIYAKYTRDFDIPHYVIFMILPITILWFFLVYRVQKENVARLLINHYINSRKNKTITNK